MGSTIRRISKSVHKIASRAGLGSEQAELATDVVAGISKSGSCHLSEIGRALNDSSELIQIERRLSRGLAAPDEQTELMRLAYLDEAAPTAAKMDFVAVDWTEVVKPHGKEFEYLDRVRDGSSPSKEVKPGYWTVEIEAVDDDHRNLPLWCEVYSTKAPGYTGRRETILFALEPVIDRVGRHMPYLFDRGFDDVEHFRALQQLGIQWIARQIQDRHVLLGNGEQVLMKDLAGSLNKPHRTKVKYVCKKTHEVKHWPVNFGYAPVRLPGLEGQLYLIVISTGRDEDIVLLTNMRIKKPADAARIVRGYVRRWGVEEGIRFWKQKTHVEDFRVRRYDAIRRLTFLSMVAWGIQALWLIKAPARAAKYIARVKVFIENVLFRHYRLWDGVADALAAGA